MAARAFLTWFVLLIGAVANGAFREMVLVPRLGVTAAQAVSTLMLSVFIVVLGWFALPWIRPESVRHAWAVGAGWLALTLAFEFLAGHYLFGKAWSVLLEDYDVRAGRTWVLVLVVTALTPIVMFVQGAMGRVAR
jgi:hypothetical protein